MGDGYVVSPTDLLHASQSLDSAVDQLKDASDQVKQATLPDGTLGIDKYLAAITTAFNTSVSARAKDIKSCAEILDGMIEALGDTIKEYHKHEKETAEHFDKIRESYEKTMDDATDKIDPFTAPELDSGGATADGSGDSGTTADGSGTGDGSDTAGGTDGTDSGSASAPGDAGGDGGAGAGAGACGEHPLSED
jgi:hypothetical protein